MLTISCQSHNVCVCGHARHRNCLRSKPLGGQLSKVSVSFSHLSSALRSSMLWSGIRYIRKQPWLVKSRIIAVGCSVS